jgi:hypothetical protein
MIDARDAAAFLAHVEEELQTARYHHQDDWHRFKRFEDVTVELLPAPPATDYNSHENILLWGMSAIITEQELLQHPSTVQHRYAAARLKLEMDLDDIVYAGYAPRGWHGLNDWPVADAVTVAYDPARLSPLPMVNVGRGAKVVQAATGRSGSTRWASKTENEIIDDVNNLIIVTPEFNGAGELTVHPRTTLLLPVNIYAELSLRSAPDGNGTALDVVARGNLYTHIRHQRPLPIVARRWLKRPTLLVKLDPKLPLSPIIQPPVVMGPIGAIFELRRYVKALRVETPELIRYLDGA